MEHFRYSDKPPRGNANLLVDATFAIGGVDVGRHFADEQPRLHLVLVGSPRSLADPARR